MPSHPSSRRTALNVVANVGEQLVIGISMFVMYGFLARECGLEQIGVMSLALVIAQAAQTANIGMASALMRFVPMAMGRQREKELADYISASAISTAVFFALFCLFAYWPLKLFVAYAAGEGLAALADTLVLPATLYVLLLNLALVTQSALAAMQKATIRSLLSCTSSLIGLVAIVMLVPIYGISAAIWVLAGQAGLLFIAGWIYLVVTTPNLHLLPRRWDIGKSRELFRLGMQMQLISVFLLFLEPVTRFYLGLYGTLEQLAIFTLAWRMVVQVRGLIYYAATAVMPVFGILNETDLKKRDIVYHRFTDLIVYLTLPIFVAMVLFAPAIGGLWLGRDDPKFALYTILLVIGYLPSTLGLGSYLLAVTTGYMRTNIGAHATVAVLNLTVGAMLSYAIGGAGAIIAVSVALFILGIALSTNNRRHLGLEAVRRDVLWDYILFGAGLVTIGIGATFNGWFVGLMQGRNIAIQPEVAVLFEAVITFFAAMLPFMWLHPERRRLWDIALSMLHLRSASKDIWKDVPNERYNEHQ